jgi:hypothetical protein
MYSQNIHNLSTRSHASELRRRKLQQKLQQIKNACKWTLSQPEQSFKLKTEAEI